MHGIHVADVIAVIIPKDYSYFIHLTILKSLYTYEYRMFYTFFVC